MGHPANNCNVWRSYFSDVTNNSVGGHSVVQTLTCRGEIIVLTKAIVIVKDWITMLRKASEARVNRRLPRYYPIVLLLPNIFTLACLLLGSI